MEDEILETEETVLDDLSSTEINNVDVENVDNDSTEENSNTENKIDELLDKLITKIEDKKEEEKKEEDTEEELKELEDTEETEKVEDMEIMDIVDVLPTLSSVAEQPTITTEQTDTIYITDENIQKIYDLLYEEIEKKENFQEISVFDKPIIDYSVSETLLLSIFLILLVNGFVSLVKSCMWRWR